MATPEELLGSRSAYVEAPAGCGKTHLIADAAAKCKDGRQLILTHTHAGVRAIRRHLMRAGASASQYALSTIAGWCLLYTASYPRTSGIPTVQPVTKAEWDGVYSGTLAVLSDSAICAVPRATYSGAIVDEYQDCTKEQHEVVKALAGLIPTRILGDPLQGIFGFGGNNPIDWESDVEGEFERLAALEVPWRWRSRNQELGEWLQFVRDALLREAPVDLRDSPTGAVEWQHCTPAGRTGKQIAACFSALQDAGSQTAAIHNMPNQCRFLASRLKGRYQCVEANEAPDLLEHARRIQESTSAVRADAVVELVCKCISGLSSKLGGVRSLLRTGKIPDPHRYKRSVPIVEAIAGVCRSDGFECVQHLVSELVAAPGCNVYRWEVLRDFQKGLAALIGGEAEQLVDAIWHVRDRSRRIGRLTPRRVIGTTKLLKGLEFDAVIVLDAEELDRRDLYVALTRASKRLVVLSESPVLQPAN